MEAYDVLLALGFQVGRFLVTQFTKSKFPQEVIDAAQNAVDAIEKHAQDKMTKADWEALRG